MNAAITADDWSRFSSRVRRMLERGPLLAYMQRCRWFREKSHRAVALEIADRYSIGRGLETVHLCIVNVDLDARSPSVYLVPIALASGGDAERATREHPERTIESIVLAGASALLYDGVYSASFRSGLLALLFDTERVETEHGALVVRRGVGMGLAPRDRGIESCVLHAEQSNSSINYDDRYFLKLFRKIDEGINPDIELTRYLGETAHFPHVPRFIAALEYETARRSAVALLTEYVPSRGDAWEYVRTEIDRYFDGSLSGGYDERAFREWIVRIGRRTGEMHRALASIGSEGKQDRFTVEYQRFLRGTLEERVRRTMERVRSLREATGSDRDDRYAEVLALEEPVLRRFRMITERPIDAVRIRIHGDYHLGQLLCVGDDVVVIDLEGEPARSLEERRRKYSAFRDVAGMMRSFHYALYDRYLRRVRDRPDASTRLQESLLPWFMRTSDTFLDAYRTAVRGTELIPRDRSAAEMLLRVFLIEKAVYELGYELDNRPDWIAIPIAGIRFALTA